MKIKMVVLAIVLSILLILPATSYQADMAGNSYPLGEGDTRLLTTTGSTLYVGGSGPNNYTSIQDAINDASDGDTIYVYDDSSPYHEIPPMMWLLVTSLSKMESLKVFTYIPVTITFLIISSSTMVGKEYTSIIPITTIYYGIV